VLHTPDDVIVRSDGFVYFTDGDFPPVGTVDLAPLPVYGIMPGGSKLINGGSVGGPNGIELSPDEKILYVDAYFEGSVYKFSMMPDGTFMKGPPLITGLTNPDSMCLDAAGNLYVGVSTGLQIIRPDGSRVGLIPVTSAQGVTNCDFGGDDGKTLYITAWKTIWQLPNVPVPGLEWVENRQRLGCM
jgi:gluconolactonase